MLSTYETVQGVEFLFLFFLFFQFWNSYHFPIFLNKYAAGHPGNPCKTPFKQTGAIDIYHPTFPVLSTRFIILCAVDIGTCLCACHRIPVFPRCHRLRVFSSCMFSRVCHRFQCFPALAFVRVTCYMFPALATGFMFSAVACFPVFAIGFNVFPRLSPCVPQVTCFPCLPSFVLLVTCFSRAFHWLHGFRACYWFHFSRVCLCACHWLHVFPSFSLVTSFPTFASAIVTNYMFSHQCLYIAFF